MKILVGKSPPSEPVSELELIINEINQLATTDFSIEIVDDTLLSNSYIYLGSGGFYAQLFPSEYNYVEANWELFRIF